MVSRARSNATASTVPPAAAARAISFTATDGDADAK